MSRFTTGERRGLIALLIVLALFAMATGVRTIWIDNNAVATTDIAAADSVIATLVSGDTIPKKPKRSRAEKKTSSKKKPAKSHQPATPRDPLNEPNN